MRGPNLPHLKSTEKLHIGKRIFTVPNHYDFTSVHHSTAMRSNAFLTMNKRL